MAQGVGEGDQENGNGPRQAISQGPSLRAGDVAQGAQEGAVLVGEGSEPIFISIFSQS